MESLLFLLPTPPPPAAEDDDASIESWMFSKVRVGDVNWNNACFPSSIVLSNPFSSVSSVMEGALPGFFGVGMANDGSTSVGIGVAILFVLCAF